MRNWRIENLVVTEITNQIYQPTEAEGYLDTVGVVGSEPSPRTHISSPHFEALTKKHPTPGGTRLGRV